MLIDYIKRFQLRTSQNYPIFHRGEISKKPKGIHPNENEVKEPLERESTVLDFVDMDSSIP